MTVPKPGSWIKPAPPVEPVVQKPKTTKKPFQLKPHLTDKPLSKNNELSELKNSLEKGTK